MDYQLTAEQMESYSRNGYLVLDQPLMSETEVEWCRDHLLSMIEQGKGQREGRNFDLAAREGGTGGPSPQILKPSLYSRQLRNQKFRDAALSIAKQLLGPETSYAGDHAILKPGRIGGPTPWHQDEAFGDPTVDSESLSIWIALTQCTLANGAMSYIPGSHRIGILPHRLHGGSKEANSIECYDGFDPANAVTKPIPPGTAIIHHCRMLHGASGNKSDMPRFAYILQYSRPATPHPVYREFPWLKDLRKTERQRRTAWLRRGGIFPEIVRRLISERNSLVGFVSGRLRYFFAHCRSFFLNFR